MNSKTSTLIAFLLNAIFSIIEIIFGLIFGSSAILADAIHDAGDALAIGLSAFLERISYRQADSHFSLGYKRFSLLGAIITSTILITGSIFMFIENIPKLFNPQPVNYQGVLVLGIAAIIVNVLASLVVRNGQTRNEAILSLHFLEDILGWVAVIVVSIVLHFTDWFFLDPLLSLLISAFILSQALPKFWHNIILLLEGVPEEIDLESLKTELTNLPGVHQIYQLSVWSIDGVQHEAILHVCLAPDSQIHTVKTNLRKVLANYSITSATIDCESSLNEHQEHCNIKPVKKNHHGHSHHH